MTDEFSLAENAPRGVFLTHVLTSLFHSTLLKKVLHVFTFFLARQFVEGIFWIDSQRRLDCVRTLSLVRIRPSTNPVTQQLNRPIQYTHDFRRP